MRAFLLVAAVATVIVIPLALAAPAAKPKEEKVGPITDEQLDIATNRLKQIALAWHNYEAANGSFPSNEVDAKGKALLSWRVQILPYIEEEKLYREFKLDEPWDSDHNKKLIDRMPQLYAPIRVKQGDGLTFYQSTTGKHGLLKSGEKLSFANIADGTSNTFMLLESGKSVTWTKPDDLVFDGKDVPSLGGMFDGKFHAAFCDGSVRRYRKDIKAEILNALVSPAGGEVIDGSEGIDK